MNLLVYAKTESDYNAINLKGIPHHKTFVLTSEKLRTAAVCIIMSPLGEGEVECLKEESGTKYFAYAGAHLRENFDVLSTFQSTEELQVQIRAYQEAYLENLKSTYLDEAHIFTDEDQKYVNLLRGKPLENEPLVKKQARFKRPRNSGIKASTKHISVLGSHPSFFKTLVKAQKKRRESIAIIDCDLLRPSLDSVFGLTTIESKINTQLSGLDNTGLNVLLDSMQKGIGIQHVLSASTVRVKENIDLILGNYNLYNYEHYDTNIIRALIQKLKYHYDAIYTISPIMLYDELTLALVHDSDQVVLVGENNRAHVRNILGTVEILEYRQKVAHEKMKCLFFNTSIGNGHERLEAPVLRALFKDQYRGLFSGSLLTNRQASKRLYF